MRISPEQELYIAVIIQQFCDALSRSNSRESRCHRIIARSWLLGKSKGFRTICYCAGIDPDFVQRKAKEAIAKNIRVIAEPTKGKRYLDRKAHRDKLKRLGLSPRKTYAGKPILKLVKQEERVDA